MPIRFPVALVILLLSVPAVGRGEVLVRWDLDDVPARDSLGISTLLVPAAKKQAVESALAAGYTVYLELDGAELPVPAPARTAGAVVPGSATPEQLRALRRRLPAGARLLAADDRGKWPHVRLNWVTRRNNILQVASRTAQPWLENNGALVQIARSSGGARPLLSYPWQPITISDMHQGPGVDNYLVAIAEAATFGGDLVLPLHEGFQRSLLMGLPAARAGWQEIRKYLEFYSWDLASRYERVANIGVVTADPMRDFEPLNLLVRHNLPFELLAPRQLAIDERFELLVVTERLGRPQRDLVEAFAEQGGTVVLTAEAAGVDARDVSENGGGAAQDSEEPVRTEAVVREAGRGRVLELQKPITDPNAFAMHMREVLGPERRPVDIWNGITVLASPYRDPSGGTVMISLLNYAHEPQPVQLRVRGTFDMVHYETPGEDAVLLPFRPRGEYTEFVLPALRIGGRVFLSRGAELEQPDAGSRR